MKTKLCIAGLVLISLLTYSCSNDDGYEMQEVKSNNFKIVPQVGLKEELKEKEIDSATVILNAVDGDPINPKPPRN